MLFCSGGWIVPHFQITKDDLLRISPLRVKAILCYILSSNALILFDRFFFFCALKIVAVYMCVKANHQKCSIHC